MATAGLTVIFDSACDEKPPRVAELDIVAVHGLSFKNSEDHARKTWTMGDKMWLKDFLPHALSRSARVMLFQYNSSPAVGAAAIKLDDHATNLLQWLKLKRKALVAATLDESYKSIVETTRLLVFFATPHQGGNYASIGDIITKIARTCLIKPSNSLVDALKRNSNEATKRFEQSRHLYEKCLVVSFFEGEGHNKMGGIIVDKKSATLNLPGTREKQVAMHANHNSICKFESTKSLACELVLGTIEDEVERALKMDWAAPSRMPSYPLSLIAPVKTFVQRPSLRENIRDQFTRPLIANRQGEARKVGVWGMGGAGKTQLALSYLQHYRTEYDATFWIQADQPASINNDFLAIYQLLSGTSSSPCNLSPGGVRREVLARFTKAAAKSLLVFDGADGLHQADENFVALPDYFPGSPNVHIIILSRASIVKDISTFDGVFVDQLEESQSVKLFLSCADIQLSRKNAVEEAKHIVHELGHLALAVSMAGKYVSQTPRLSSNLSAYLDEFRRRRREVLSETPEELVDRYHHSVMTVWETSYLAVSKQLPEAARLLTMLCFIHHEDIFLELFGLGVDSSSIEAPSWTSILESQSSLDLHFLEKCFRVLRKYSLCQYKTTQGSYSTHQLIQAWGCDRLKDNREVMFFWSAASKLLYDYLQSTNGYPVEPAMKLRIVSHLTDNIQSFRRASKDMNQNQLDALRTLQRFETFFGDIGRWNEAALSQREILAIVQRVFGEGHLHTIDAMNNLASTLHNYGKLDEAVELQNQVLEKRQRILGHEHIRTIMAINNLASTLNEQGDFCKAAAMQKQVLEKRKQILGDEHPETIMAMNNFAGTLHNQGKMDQAEAMQKQVLEKFRLSLGDEHSATIMAMNNFAGTLHEQGKLDQAAVLQKQVLEKRQRMLGDEHPDTISAMYNISVTLHKQGQLNDPAVIQKQVLEKSRLILGDEHTDRITAMNKFAHKLYNQGKLDEAVVVMRRVLKKRQRIFGDEHPDTIEAASFIQLYSTHTDF
ncbi:hypothetical protein QQS21_005608 [Conoideocrella luteorostrata]|uniref:NB-ARC domain-containing protein n=1 Tax=Conoideocrella luteorostrata TaxID=1105319 RepID=A0AAJ0CRM8_9HYPO|nr:hypothetical protein QQS21_005608 [Conoideocrella luteorostrata]